MANIVEVTNEESSVDKTMIIDLAQYISKETTVTVEELKKIGLTPIVIGNGKYVTNQYPLNKARVIKGSKVFIKTNDDVVTMPNMTGWSENEVIRYCNFVGLSYKLEGYGKVVSQSIKVNTIVDKSMTLEINLTV